MKILIAARNEPNPDSGAAGSLEQLSQELKRLDQSVELILGTQKLSRFQDSNWSTFDYPVRLRNLLIKKNKSDGPFDMIQISSAEGYAFGKLKGPWKHIFRTHGLENRRWEQYFNHFPFAKKNLKFYLWFRALRCFLEQLALDRADAVIVMCQKEKEFILEKGWKSSEEIFVIPNGVSQYFKPNDHKKYDVVFSNSWIEGKGIHVIPKIIETLRQKIPNLKVLMLGTGKSREQVLKNFPAHLHSHLEIEPQLSQLELAQKMSQAKCLLFTSFFEGFGKAFLEAMACGVIPICFEVGATSDIIQHEKSGYLIEIGHWEKMADYTYQLLNNPTLQKQMREQALQIAQNYTWDKIATQTIEAYQKILNKTSS